MLFVDRFLFGSEQWRTQELFMGEGFNQWHMVDICIWCALFLTSHSVAILEWKKWEGHCRAKEQVGGAT